MVSKNLKGLEMGNHRISFQGVCVKFWGDVTGQVTIRTNPIRSEQSSRQRAMLRLAANLDL
jgi:hypothetical protein